MKRLKDILRKTTLMIIIIYLLVFSVIPKRVQATNISQQDIVTTVEDENDNTNITDTEENKTYSAQELQQKIVEFAKTWIGVTPYVWGGESLTSGADCSGFVMAIYAQFGYNLPHGTDSLLSCGSQVSYADVQLGDVIVTSSTGSQTGRHTGIYAGNGQWVNAKGKKYGTVLNDVPSGNILGVRRIVGTVSSDGRVPSFTPGDSVSGGSAITGFKGEIDDTTVSLDELDFQFSGSPQKVEYNGEEKPNPWIFSKLSQIIDYIVGIFIGSIRVSIVGWTAIIESWISSVMHSLSGTENDKIYTVEDIIFNRIPIFDVNIFSNTAGGEEVTENSPTGVIRSVVATWYIAVRNIVAIFLMIMLIYTAIRMAIATVAEEKANYKQYLIGWLKSVIVLFVIHYILMIVLNINSTLVSMFSGDSSQENLIYETIRTRAYDIRFSVGMTGMFMYIALIFMFIKFIWLYAKRFFTIIILTIISPIMVGKYSFESASGKRSTIFSKFLYLYSSNILIQSAHALIYTTLVSIALDLALENITGFILALIFMSFMLKADQIVLKLFKFDKDVGDIRAPFRKKEELAGIYYSYGIYKLAKDRAKDGLRTIKHIGASGVKAVGNRLGKEDVTSDIKEAIDKKKTKIDRFLLSKSDKYLGRNSETSQKLVLKIASRRKGTSGRLAKQALQLRKVERKQRYTSNYKFIVSEVKGVGSIILAVPTMIFSPSVGIGLASSGINTIKKNGKQEKLRHWTTKQKIANTVTFGHYGNRVEAKEKVEKNKKELDALVFSIMKSNESMDRVEIELEKYTDPEDKQKAKEVMKQVVNMKADVSKVKRYIEQYLIRNSIPSIDSMSKSELRNMIGHVTSNICRDSNLSEDVTRDAIDEVIKSTNIVVQDVNETQSSTPTKNMYTEQNSNRTQKDSAEKSRFGVQKVSAEKSRFGIQKDNTEKSKFGVQKDNTEKSKFGVQKNNREQNTNGSAVKDINRFAQVINESIVKKVAGNKFMNIAQEINKMKEAEISTKAAAEDATGDDDTELININRYIDNL